MTLIVAITTTITNTAAGLSLQSHYQKPFIHHPCARPLKNVLLPIIIATLQELYLSPYFTDEEIVK